MAEDKVKFRNTGPVHPLTRQPVADRKRSGGVKFGEWSATAYWPTARPPTSTNGPSRHYCRFYRSSENIVRITVPYGAKLLYQGLLSMGMPQVPDGGLLY
ncbi:DNA-directed RNA polymerases IV and V subunit 2-like [Triticum urartu]|uniref:DNA-directed RNA polymerases IV and V subunit 2-like n=1 Tax=Triticum urartu TaxID=4572 RepID=UPI0020444036|nr:DNA-directed RNA polymerases IV and V subunit 2-like [Triticum urartu]